MKKRILSLILVVFMLVPLVLASCSNEKTDEDIYNNIISGGEIALTLSLWIPTDSDTDSAEFKERLKEVEGKINELLLDKNYSTKIMLVPIKDSEYESELAKRFESMKDAVSKDGSAYSTADKYQNTAILNELEMYELYYPPVLDTQLDLFLIRGYDSYLSNVYAGNLQKLDSYISQNGSLYSNINKLIRPNILSQMKVNGNTYAIPNNHLYADTYQFILIDKTVFDTNGSFDIESINSILDCKEYINAIGTAGMSGVVPFVGTLNDAPGVIYMDKDNLVGGTVSNGTPSSIIENESYLKYVKLYKELEDNSYVKAELSDGERAAVKFFYGTSNDVKALEEDYYVVKSTSPVADLDGVYSSMFAVSSYSANYDRAMKVLYLLQTDNEIRTLLQYGIQNKDYEIKTNDDGEKVLNIRDTAYKMNILYTGNGYYTYPGNGLSMSDWDNVKDVNYDMIISPYIKLENYLASKISETDLASLNDLKQKVSALTTELKSSLESMTASELEIFLNAYSIDIKTVEKEISDLNLRIEGLNIDINKLQEQLAAEADEAKIAEINEKIEAKNTTLSEANEALAAATAKKAAHDASDLAVKLHSSNDYVSLVELYTKIFNSIK